MNTDAGIRRCSFTAILALITMYGLPVRAVEPPAPWGAVPSAGQLKWHEMEYYGFLHFGMNTFTGREWGDGSEPEATFNPDTFDARQIASVAESAGMKGLILVCKHHDGFCLWPSKYTDHSVKKSPWKNGDGDIVKDLAVACKKHGLKLGLALSPWDRNRKDYGSPEYIAFFRNQLRELLTNYGPIFEIWFDGANGGSGYYGGTHGIRMIDRRTYYDWKNTWQMIRELQPDTCIFSDAGPDVRWVGNEFGSAGDPCWNTFNSAPVIIGAANVNYQNSGQREATNWIPAECDVSVRPAWFYHTGEKMTRSPTRLLDIYYSSVGRGASLLLNIPPNTHGRISETDASNLMALRKMIDATFKKDLAGGAKVTASNVRGGARKFGPSKVTDDERDTYWCTDDNVLTPELILEYKRPVTFNVVNLREYLPLGQRVDAWALDRWDNEAWTEFASGTSIGNRRLWRGAEDVTTTKVRLRIVKAAACPAISEFGLYLEPAESHLKPSPPKKPAP